MARTLVAGSSGNGKSWETGRYLENVVPDFDYAVHFDPENEETGLCVEGRNGEPPVYKAFYVDRKGLAGEWDIPATIRKEQKLRVVPEGLTEQESIHLLALVCKTAMEVTDSDATFHVSVDEAHNVIPKGKVHPLISRALTGGRKRGLEWTVATQRLQKIHEDSIGQANFGIYFSMAGRDAAKVNDESVFNAEKELPKLQRFECIYENRNTTEWWKVNTEQKERAHPHHTEDDGVGDEYLMGQKAD